MTNATAQIVEQAILDYPIPSADVKRTLVWLVRESATGQPVSLQLHDVVDYSSEQDFAQGLASAAVALDQTVLPALRAQGHDIHIINSGVGYTDNRSTYNLFVGSRSEDIMSPEKRVVALDWEAIRKIDVPAQPQNLVAMDALQQETQRVLADNQPAIDVMFAVLERTRALTAPVVVVFGHSHYGTVGAAVADAAEELNLVLGEQNAVSFSINGFNVDRLKGVNMPYVGYGVYLRPGTEYGYVPGADQLKGVPILRIEESGSSIEYNNVYGLG
jgi:hypothetical protein